jgi:hypothetical protein
MRRALLALLALPVFGCATPSCPPVQCACPPTTAASHPPDNVHRQKLDRDLDDAQRKLKEVLPER